MRGIERGSADEGYETCDGRAKYGGGHASAAIMAFGGAPYGAANRAKVCHNWGGAAMRALPLGAASAGARAIGGAPCGATKRVRGVPK